MNKYDGWIKRKFWIGVLLGAFIDSIIFIFPKQLIQASSLDIGSSIAITVGGAVVAGFIDVSVYMLMGGIIAGLVAGKGIINGAKAGILAGLTIIIILAAKMFYLYSEYIYSGYLSVLLPEFITSVTMAFFLVTIGATIGGGISGLINTMPNLINSIEFKKIIQRVKLVSENLKDDKLKNTKIVYFIKTHILILALLTNLLGLLIIVPIFLPENYGQKMVNSIEINIPLEKNDSEQPFVSVNITMLFNYRGPMMEKSQLNFEVVCINFSRNPLYNESDYNPIIGMDLYLYNLEDSNSDRAAKSTIVHYINNNRLELESLNRYNCYPYKDAATVSINPYLEGPLVIGYYLGYNSVYRFNVIEGIADFSTPIRILDSAEEMNTRINKGIFILTGLLLILGSFPFFLSLKQLLEKKPKQ